MPTDTRIIKIEAINSFQSLTAELSKLESRLSQNNLNQFLIFNKAYLLVTSAIQEGARNHYFSNPQFIEKFTISFAQYYLLAVNETASDSIKLPPAWAALNTASQSRRMPNSILLLMGANAHINHDLPLALANIIDKEDANNLLSDVLKVDKLLMKSGREIINRFEENNWFLDLLRRRIIFVYYRPVMYMILYWRIRAWHNYKSIKNTGLKNSRYARRSVSIARRLMILGRLLG